MIKDGQLLPGVVTGDGVILSGNRRFRLLNEIIRNPDKYEDTRTRIDELQFFEAVILHETNLEDEQIIEYETFYQFGIEDKVEYDPIQKYIAAQDQKKLGFTEKQIARHFFTLTDGKEKKVKDWLEVFEYMKEYLGYIGEEEIYTALEGREEAFLQLHSVIKGFKTGRAGRSIWAFTDFDLDDLKLIFYDYMYTVDGNADGMIKFVRRAYKNDPTLTFIMNNSGNYMVMDLSDIDFANRIISAD